MWSGTRPSLAHIKVWGCEAFIHCEANDKLEPRSEKCYFIGYPQNSFGYLFYKPSENKAFVARRGFFIERDLISKKDSGSHIDLEELQETNEEEPLVDTSTQPEVQQPTDEPQPRAEQTVEKNDVSPPPLRRSNRIRYPPEFYNRVWDLTELI